MLRIIFLITILMSSTVFSQDVSKTDAQAQKLDEFGSLGECEFIARVDTFLVALQEQPTAKGYIIFYEGEDALPATIEDNSFGERLYMNYIRFRSFDESRMVFVKSYRKERSTELWVVPKDAKAPVPSETVPKPKISLAKAFLYDRNYLYSDYGFYNEFLLPHVKAELESLQNSEDSVNEENAIVEKNDPDEDAEIEKYKEDEKFNWISEKFGEFIKKHSKTNGLMIFYADDAEYDIGKLFGQIEQGKQKLTKDADISPERIQTQFGGYRNQMEVEFWIVPEKGKLPMPTPEERIVEQISTEDQ